MNDSKQVSLLDRDAARTALAERFELSLRSGLLHAATNIDVLSAELVEIVAKSSRPVPTREELAKAIHDAVRPDCPHAHVMYADDTEGVAADAVLSLLNGPARD